MIRKLGYLVLFTGLALPAIAAQKPGSISGYVRSVDGVPQMGALVEVLGPALQSLKVFTDENGFYNAHGLVPGTYAVRVSVPSFLPAIRDRVGLHAGGSVVINMTLSTLFDAINGIAPLRGAGADDDDWKWVLRSASNRPILRVFDQNSATTGNPEHDGREIRGTLSFVAGSPAGGYGSSSDVSTGFSLERSVFSTGVLQLRGNVGYGNGAPGTVLRAAYSQPGNGPAVAFTMRRLAAPDMSLRNGALQALALTTSDGINIGDVLELRFGSELQTIQFMGRLNAVRPFASANLHVSPNTLVSYRYASSRPDSRAEKGFDSAPADLSESGPHVSLAGFRTAIERANHHEVSVSRRLGRNNLQVAVYSDSVVNPVLTGVGEVSGDGGEVLPDLYSNSFSYRGKNIDTRGLRLVFQRKLTDNLTATVDYGYGGVLDFSQSPESVDDAREHMSVHERSSLAAKVNGLVPVSKTHWIVSYRWVSGEALTPVDAFNDSAGTADPYMNIFLRQPIPGTGFLPGHMDAVVEVRNLLAQGYVPVMGHDGHTVYLVQSARTVRGGVAFTF